MSDASAGRAAIRCVVAGWLGGALPVLLAEVLRGSAPLFVVEELAALLLGAALLASASGLGARAGSASGTTRALVGSASLVVVGVALALLSPPWVILAVPWAFLPVAAGLVVAQLWSEPTPTRAFQLATWGAVVGLFALHLLRSSPSGALLFDLAPHVPLLFGVWGALLGLVIASGDGRELRGDLPLGGGLLVLFAWASSSTIGASSDRLALTAGDPATRARALASMRAHHDLWKLQGMLRAPSGDDRPEVGDALVGMVVAGVARWPSLVEPPTRVEVRADVVRALGDHLLAGGERVYTFTLLENVARFERDPGLRQVGIETMKRLDPDWRDPLEVWVSDPDPERRSMAYISISSELHRCSCEDLLKIVSRPDELPDGELARIVRLVESVSIGDRSGAAPIARALLDGASSQLGEAEREALAKLAGPPPPPRPQEPFR